MWCMARLVRALLGVSAVAEHKLDWGSTLRLLGVDLAPSDHGLTCRPAPEKLQKCHAIIQEALAQEALSIGCASKLAGRLNWASQFLFKRLGRAMLRPIYAQIHRRLVSCK